MLILCYICVLLYKYNYIKITLKNTYNSVLKQMLDTWRWTYLIKYVQIGVPVKWTYRKSWVPLPNEPTGSLEFPCQMNLQEVLSSPVKSTSRQSEWPLSNEPPGSLSSPVKSTSRKSGFPVKWTSRQSGFPETVCTQLWLGRHSKTNGTVRYGDHTDLTADRPHDTIHSHFGD